METKLLLADYDYLYEALLKHPLLLEDEKRKQLEQIYENLKERVLDETTLINAMTTLTMFFEDGHTNIELPYTKEDLCLRLPCRWSREKLVLCENYLQIEAGAEIIAVDGMEQKEIFAWLATRIPHENAYLVNSRSIEYPYQNYHMFSGRNLAQLFGEKDSYEVTFLAEGQKRTVQCPLVAYDGFLDFPEGEFVSYEVQEDTAVLHLDQCVCDDRYKEVLAQLATLCRENQIKKLELDLSKNMGGSSAVIDEFIKYVDVDTFRRYEMIDYSSGDPLVVTRRSDRIQNSKKDVLFPKEIICRVSNTTFSSARTFAVTLKDNGIATIIGEPTGGKPCSYGMPRKDKTPNYNIRFRVSRCLFLRPDKSLDEELALCPNDREV